MGPINISYLNIYYYCASIFLATSKAVNPKIPMARMSRAVQGFLFDIDGTLADTDPLQFSVNSGFPIDHVFFR